MKIPLDMLLCRAAARFALANPVQPQVITFSTGMRMFAPDHAGVMAKFATSGGRIFVVADDLPPQECAAGRALLPEVNAIDRAAAARLIATAGKVWFW